MKKLRALRSCVVVVLSAACVAPGNPEVPGLKQAQEAARRDAATTAGKRWREQITNEWLAETIQAGGTRCDRESPSGRELEFDIYLRMSERGEVLRAWVNPETLFSTCFRDAMMSTKWPASGEERWYDFGMAPGPPGQDKTRTPTP